MVLKQLKFFFFFLDCLSLFSLSLFIKFSVIGDLINFSTSILNTPVFIGMLLPHKEVSKYIQRSFEDFFVFLSDGRLSKSLQYVLSFYEHRSTR